MRQQVSGTVAGTDPGEGRGRQRRRRRRRPPALLSLHNMAVALVVIPAVFSVLRGLEAQDGYPVGTAAMISAGSDGPVRPGRSIESGEEAPLRLASRSPELAAPGSARPQRFVLQAEEVLGYAEGRGLNHAVGPAISGTQCTLGAGAMLTWMRDRPGGSGCRMTLFSGGKLAPGWRVDAVTLRLGHGAALGEETRAAASGNRARLVPDRGALPLGFTLLGTVPLAGARFWAALDQIELSGPPGAADWHLAFATAAEGLPGSR